MSTGVVSFDEIRDLVTSALDSIGPPKDATAVFVVRDIFGKIGLSASENARSDALVDWLYRLARTLEECLGAHGRPAERASLWIEPKLLDEMRDTALPIRPGVFWTDRLLTGENWWTVGEERPQREPVRYTLHSVEGGMGRSTAATVLAWHLARRGERVLAVDLDIESPGLASAALDEVQPKFGVVDWFVEELVGQGHAFLPDMVATPAWASELPGAVWIVPAHGRNAGEYLPKLGRVYADTITDPWIARLQRLLGNLEAALKPTVIVVDSPSGLHDIAAATVAGIGAEAMLFAVDSASAWTGYAILFDHWRAQGLAPLIRERLSVVSALTPKVDARRYLDRFRENAWNLFRDRIYAPVAGPNDEIEAVSHDLLSERAPHDPLVIHRNCGSAAGAPLRRPEESVVRPAYSPFLRRFDRLHDARAAKNAPARTTGD